MHANTRIHVRPHTRTSHTFTYICAHTHTRLNLLFIHSFIPAISIAPLQVLYYSEALPTTARILFRSFTPKRARTHTHTRLRQNIWCNGTGEPISRLVRVANSASP